MAKHKHELERAHQLVFLDEKRPRLLELLARNAARRAKKVVAKVALVVLAVKIGQQAWGECAC